MTVRDIGQIDRAQIDLKTNELILMVTDHVGWERRNGIAFRKQHSAELDIDTEKQIVLYTELKLKNCAPTPALSRSGF